MPAARWQSSQGPLFVRTVWVNGLRHAILSADDPLFQCRGRAGLRCGGRSGSCSSVGTYASPSGSARSSGDLEHCLVKLQLVLSSNRSSTKSNTAVLSSRPHQDTEPCCGKHHAGAENSSVGAASVVGRYRRQCVPYVLQSSSEEETEQDPVEDDPRQFSDAETLFPDLQLNPLSERVLQWLDLVGRTAGIVDGSEHTAFVSRFGKRNNKGRRPTARHFSTPTPPLPSEVETGGKYASRRKSQLQRDDVGGKVPTVTVHTSLETAVTSTSVEEDTLHVSARELKTFRRKHQAFKDTRAVIDETVRRVSAVTEDVCFHPSDCSRTPEQLSAADSALSHRTAPAPSRPQLHIFMPSLQSDRPALRHQDAADDVSESDSYWSETWS
jgi:hypothetical protein